MIDLAKLEQDLNTDFTKRQDFLRDPVAVFQRNGILLSPDQQTTLRMEIAQQKAQRSVVPGVRGNVEALGRVRLGVGVFWGWDWSGRMTANSK
jgi:hypothetical protein